MAHNLVMATQNQFKLAEAKQILEPLGFNVVSPKEAGYLGDFSETGTCLEANASEKVQRLHQATGMDAFADDTGLEVYSLRGKPGVHSARFAGPDANAAQNIALLLQEMKPMDDRKARFRTVVALMLHGCLHLFEGIVSGQIAHAPQGEAGFGYDPIFIPEGTNRSFAQYTQEEKNAISHRGKALRQMHDYLKKQGRGK